MNWFDLSASDLMIWGLVLHLIADWPLQNDWMANNKARRGRRLFHAVMEGNCVACGARWHVPNSMPRRCSADGGWWNRHPAAWMHSGIHCLFMAIVFGWVAILVAFIHLIIDTRVPVIWWSQLIGQTQPNNPVWIHDTPLGFGMTKKGRGAPLMDVGMGVRFWTDQVFHIVVIAIAALVVNL